MSDVEDAPPVEVGDVLADKYEVERVLGIGGMGAVVAARHLELGELRALKFMLPAMSANQEAVGRFLREARAVAKLQSEHVAKIHDIGRLERGDPYLVMEYLEGEDLKDRIKRTAPMPVEKAASFVLQALAGLAEAHAHGIVHRDLKPPNLFIAKGSDHLSRVKILDFGVSKLTDHDLPELDKTKTNAMLGSPYYMSPEQMESTRDVDARSDIWSMGVILYEMLTGHVPFDGPSITALTIKVVQHDPEPVSENRDDIPPELDKILERCLAKDPANRYPDVATLAEDLAPFALERDRNLAELAARTLRGSAFDSEAPPTSEAPSDDEEEHSSVPPLQGTKTTATWDASGEASPDALRKRYLLIGAALGAIAMAVFVAVSSSDDDAQPVAADSARVEAAESPTPSETKTAPDPAASEEAAATPSAEPSSSASTSASTHDPASTPAAKKKKAKPKRDVYDEAEKEAVGADVYGDPTPAKRRRTADPYD